MRNLKRLKEEERQETPIGFQEAVESEEFKYRLQLIADRLTIEFHNGPKHDLSFFSFCDKVPENRQNVLYWYGYLRCLYFFDCVGRAKKSTGQHHMSFKKMIAMWWGGDSFSLDGVGGRKTEYVWQEQVDLALKDFLYPNYALNRAYTFARKVKARSFGFQEQWRFGNYSDEHYSPSVIPTLPEPYQKIMFPKRH